MSHSTVVNRPAPSVAVIGATGAVGREIIGCLEKRAFPLSRLRLLASARSAGQKIPFKGRELPVETLDEKSLKDVDIALFSAGSSVTKLAAPTAGMRTVIIDNSSAFRMDANVPLVIPEVNPGTTFSHSGIIANPNCTAIISAMALWPLHLQNPIRRVIASTYQAASGAGAAAMEELRQSTEAFLANRPFTPRVLPHPYAFNVFSHNTAIDPVSGSNDEEIKVMRELRKIMNLPELRIGITCVRVPVLRAHTIVMSVEFERPMRHESVREILSTAPGVRLADDRTRNHFPMPNEATGHDEVIAGRFRPDLGDPTGHTVSMMVAGDQLLKGAALNAVQIAELVIRGAP
ncbi:MAG: aspartate-semialdehyde dehydrogenase [Micropepsaceae bacterium]